MADDFLIAEKPQSLIIYNGYEQLLDKKQKNYFPPFSPFKILIKKTLLGDGLTPVLKAEWRKQIFFLGLNAEGSLVSQKNFADYKILNGCLVYGDTVKVICTRGIPMYGTGDAVGPLQKHSSQGERLIRLFVYKSNAYVNPMFPNASYYWIKKENTRCFEKWTADVRPLSSHISPELWEQVSEYMKGINITYQKYFSFFNRIHNKESKAPFWQEEKDACFFYLNSSGEEYNLIHSTALLLKNINLRLSGSGFHAVFNADEKKIYIKRVNDNPL